MEQIKTFLREQLILIVAAFVSVSTQPAILHAQEINPIPFVEPLSVSRGKIIPSNSEYAAYLSKTDTCKIAIENWGWDDCTGIDAFFMDTVPNIDSTVVMLPTLEGFVELDDWESEDRNDMIRQIEEADRRGLAAQSQKLGIPIRYDGWVVHPTLNTKRQFMYYASKSTWEGDPVINITATIFDRRGSVRFLIVPFAETVTGQDVEDMILASLDQYQPNPGEDYASFVTGDKVAAYGAVGALAGLAGLKYSKGIAGFFGVALLFLKKAWFILLFPLIWLKSLFTRGKNKDS